MSPFETLSDRGEKTLPQNLEAERSVLGALLLNNEGFDQLEEIGLKPSDFYSPSHASIYEVMGTIFRRGEPVDLVTVTSELRARGSFDRCGGSATLTALFDEAFATANLLSYAKIIQSSARLRAFIQIASNHIGQAYSGGVSDEFFDNVEKDVLSLAHSNLKETGSWIEQTFTDELIAIETEVGNPPKPGLLTGFHDFDKMTFGLQPGQLIIIAGRPAMGKTAVVLSMIQNMSITNGKVVAFFSLEMLKKQITNRIISSTSRISGEKLKTRNLQQLDLDKLAQVAPKIAKAPIYIEDTSGLTVWDIRTRCRKIIAERGRLDAIVVDYLQLLQGEKSGYAPREQEIADICRSLKCLAKELKVPVIALAQLNRAVDTRVEKRPLLGDLRESGSLEQDADIVCFIYRDEVYNKETQDRGVAEFIVAKHREGEPGTVRLAWMPEYTRFDNLAKASDVSVLREQRTFR